jgi:hypothetical protein
MVATGNSFEMPKLFVAGCSFSDFTKVKKVYGQYLAEKLNYDYVHEGAGCGSNWRMWRVLTHHILSGNLTPDDLLIVQYSDIHRAEFWTSIRQPDFAFDPQKVDHIIHERYKTGGTVTRFKMFSHEWQHNALEKQFHNMYENHFLSDDFEIERFVAHNHMFQCMLKEHNITPVFIKTFRYRRDQDSFLPEFEPFVFHEEHYGNREELNLDLAENDPAHLSAYGHKVYADLLFDHVHKVGLI